MFVAMQAVGNSRSSAGDQRRSPHVGCIVVGRSAATVIGRCLLTSKVCALSREKLCATRAPPLTQSRSNVALEIGRLGFQVTQHALHLPVERSMAGGSRPSNA